MNTSESLERRVTVHQLRIFRTVADLASFSRAAESLHLSQPGVSHQVKALADAVGGPVLEVIGRSVQTTEIGRLLYEHATRILAEFEHADRALDELHGLRRGTLRVSGDTTVGIYVLPDVLGAFKAAHPGVEVRLDVGNREHVYQQIIDGESDFAVVGRLRDRPSVPLATQPFLPNELIAIVAPSHPLAESARVSMARFGREPFIVRELGSGTRETADEALARTKVPVRIVMELASNGAIKRAVAGGLGVAIVSRHSVSLELRLGLVVEVPVTGFPLHRQWHLVHPSGRRLGPVGTAFLEFIDAGSWRAAVGQTLT
ncbi:MAG: LysR substrate-binding domain-containing protein, partial [Candidatus Limnocylindria bacterium]